MCSLYQNFKKKKEIFSSCYQKRFVFTFLWITFTYKWETMKKEEGREGSSELPQ